MTAQNPARVISVMPSTPEFLKDQLDAVFSEFNPNSLKTGMLYDIKLVEVVAQYLQKFEGKIVIDPVMVSTSGAQLLKRDAVQAIQDLIFPYADLVTPNLDELILLLGHNIKNISELESAAEEFFSTFHVPILAKGGHLRDSENAVDILWNGKKRSVYKERFVADVSTHGTGCTFSAAIAANLAKGMSTEEAVSISKSFISKAIKESVEIGNHYALNWFGW